jgi:hypothetical protein
MKERYKILAKVRGERRVCDLAQAMKYNKKEIGGEVQVRVKEEVKDKKRWRKRAGEEAKGEELMGRRRKRRAGK